MSMELSTRKKMWLTFRRNKPALLGAVVTVTIILISIFAPWIAPHDPLVQEAAIRLESANSVHLLGTDDFGRDVLSRIIYGSRVSLVIGVASVFLGMIVGTAAGMVAGYYRGKIETLIMRGIDVMMCFPDLILAIAITAVLGANLTNLIITLGLVMMPRFARLAHGQVLSLTESEYVVAARSIGLNVPRILGRHIFPNIFGELLVAGTLWIGVAIRLEANLAFVGLGVAPPTPTWGNMIREGVDVMINAPWISIYSGLAILVTILAFNMLGDGLRDISDPRLRGA